MPVHTGDIAAMLEHVADLIEIEDLKAAADKGRIAGVEGFGETLQAKIREALECFHG